MYHSVVPQIQKRSNISPNAVLTTPARADVRRLVFEAARRAEAMGLIEPAAAPRDETTALRLLASRVRRAGIAAAVAERLDASGVNNVEVPDPAEIVPLLETMIAALEASPVPKFEWTGLGRIFASDNLAALIHVSLSSLKRYVSGARETPDDVAARLHFLALVVGDLAGSYNDVGIRRWFQRPRTRLAGRAPAVPVRLPAAVLRGGQETYARCQQEAAALRRRGHTRIVAPTAALKPGSAGGVRVHNGVGPAPPRDGRVFVVFGPPGDLVGWIAANAGCPAADLLSPVNPLT